MSDFDFDVITGPIERRDEKPAEPPAPPVAGATAVADRAPAPPAAEEGARRTG